uniref:Uncharacterized protein n=1 Tax=Lates calcarifer TaxID=8187 RepID=A0A4W6F8W8_LATCA
MTPKAQHRVLNEVKKKKKKKHPRETTKGLNKSLQLVNTSVVESACQSLPYPNHGAKNSFAKEHLDTQQCYWENLLIE